MKTYITIIGAFVIALAALSLGNFEVKTQAKSITYPIKVSKEVIKEVPIEVIKEIQVVKEVPKYYETIKEAPVEVYKYPEYRILGTIDELPKASLMTLQPNVCLSVAQDLQKSYLSQGIITSVAVAYDHQYYQKYVTESPSGHAGLLVETKEGWYFVDPIDWKITKLW